MWKNPIAKPVYNDAVYFIVWLAALPPSSKQAKVMTVSNKALTYFMYYSLGTAGERVPYVSMAYPEDLQMERHDNQRALSRQSSTIT